MTQENEDSMIELQARMHPDSPIFQIMTMGDEPCPKKTEMWVVLISDRGQLCSINFVVPKDCNLLNLDVHPDFTGCKRFFFGFGSAVFVNTEQVPPNETMQ